MRRAALANHRLRIWCPGSKHVYKSRPTPPTRETYIPVNVCLLSALLFGVLGLRLGSEGCIFKSIKYVVAYKFTF